MRPLSWIDKDFLLAARLRNHTGEKVNNKFYYTWKFPFALPLFVAPIVALFAFSWKWGLVWLAFMAAAARKTNDRK